MENKIFFIALAMNWFLLGSCYHESIITPDSVITNIALQPASIPADGVSRTLVTIMLPDETTDVGNSITVTATKGLFDIVAKNTATVTAQNVYGSDGKLHKEASIYLVSSTDETSSSLTVSVKNYSKTESIDFTRAYPDSIRVKVDKLIYVPGNNAEITVTTQIKRNPGNGTPSAGQVISLTAEDSAGQPIGVFRNRNVITDATGTCVNYFSLDPKSPYTGSITFKTSVSTNANGGRALDSGAISVTH